MSSTAVCNNTMICPKPGTLRCTRCKGASPETLYCGPACQKQDWKFHKAYCGRQAYTFKLTLLGTSNPVITRVFDVPAWFTFRQLHYTIQYAMGPWQCTHLHQFTFEVLSSRPRNCLSPRHEVLKIAPASSFEDEFDISSLPGVPPQRYVPKEAEETLLLSDVFDPAGRLKRLVAPNDEFLPLLYLYDFGDNWDHKLIFKGSKLARADRPLFSAASGCGPVEDSGGVTGWNAVKKGFRSPNATAEQRDRVPWAKEVSGLGERFDPFSEPDVKVMNYEGRWENHLEAFMEASGEHVERPSWATDSDEEDVI